MNICELIPTDEFKNECKFGKTEIDLCSSDHRKADKKTLLFMLPGVNFDTYELADEYIKASPAAIVTEDLSKFPKSRIPIIEVKNARRAYAYAVAAINKIDFNRMVFIGITGTNGKTSTATMIKKIIEYDGRCVGFIGTGKIEYKGINYAPEHYSMTTPDPELLFQSLRTMQALGCETVVMEVSSHALQLEKTAPIIFDIGIFTGLSHDHLEFHGSMEKYFSAKEKLINNCKSAIINFDDPWGKKLYEKYSVKSTGIGVVWRSDISACDVENHGLAGIGYIYKGRNFLTRVKLPLPGMHNIYNSMMAFDTAYKLNIKPKIIKEALASINNIEGRCECIYGDVTVIVDYAHTPAALESVLKTAYYSKKASQKITLVFGCGGNRDKTKRPLMAKIAEKFADRIIVTNDNPRNESEENIINDIIMGFEERKYGVIADRELAIVSAIKNAAANDIVIVAGKGHEKYMIDKNGYLGFDEKAIIEKALSERKSEAINEV